MIMKRLIEIMGMIFSAFLSVIISNCLLPLNLSIFVGIIMLLVLIILFILDIYRKEKKRMNEELLNLKNDLKKVENENKILQNLPVESTRGNRFFLMAISQDLCNPLYTGILQKAVFEEHNVFAGYLLGNIYYSGLEHNGKEMIKCDYNMAAKVYKTINPNDEYGVSDWMLGWLYQLKMIEEAKNNTEENNLIIARKYYEMSQKKGYPKALNSLANLMINRRAGYDTGNEIEAISLYQAAAQLEDNYALLNCGHYYKNQRKNYIDALNCYMKSAEFNCPEGCVNVGEVLEKLSPQDEGYNNEIIKACHYYIKCIKLGEFIPTTNQKKKFVAKAYYKLGIIVNNMDTLDEQTNSFFNNYVHRDICPYCFSEAYSILTSLIDFLPADGNEEFYDIYSKLANMYHNPEIIQ